MICIVNIGCTCEVDFYLNSKCLPWWACHNCCDLLCDNILTFTHPSSDQFRFEYSSNDAPDYWTTSTILNLCFKSMDISYMVKYMYIIMHISLLHIHLKACMGSWYSVHSVHICSLSFRETWNLFTLYDIPCMVLKSSLLFYCSYFY